MSEWIPVGERLPEPELPVLVLCSFAGHDHWMDVTLGDEFSEDVTHWMPLPPLPDAELGQ